MDYSEDFKVSFFIAAIIVLVIIVIIIIIFLLYKAIATRDKISEKIEKDPHFIILRDLRKREERYNGHREFNFHIEKVDDGWITGKGIPRDHSLDKEGKRMSDLLEYDFEFKESQYKPLPKGLFSRHADYADLYPETSGDLNEIFKDTPLGQMIARHIEEINHLKSQVEFIKTSRKEKLTMEMENLSSMKSDDNVVNRAKRQQIERPPMFPQQNNQQGQGGDRI